MENKRTQGDTVNQDMEENTLSNGGRARLAQSHLAHRRYV